VVGCAGIAGKTCEGIKEAENARVVAVASRNMLKAEGFAKTYTEGAKPYSSYDAVLKDTSVDVVYVPLPTTMKKDMVMKAAAEKKHILCEKPLAGNVKDAEEMIEACRQNGVQFMDNTMMMHHSRLEEIKKVLENKKDFGDVKHVVSCFTIPFGNDDEWAGDNIRMNSSLEPMGALGDLGWYNIRLSQWAFKYEEPEEVCCHYFDKTEEGVPITAHAILRYSGGCTATFDCSFKCCLRQWAEVVGTKQTVSWDDLCVTQDKVQAPFTVATAGIGENAITFPKQIIQQGNVENCVQHKKLIENMSNIVLGKKLDDKKLDDHWPFISLQTQKIMMALHESAARRGGAWVKFRGADLGSL